MSAAKIKIPGTVETTVETPLRQYFPDVEAKFYPVNAIRGVAGQEKEVELEGDDVVMTTFENNIQWIHNGGEFINKLRVQQPPSRGANAAELTIPLQWQENNAQARGIVSGTLKLLGIHIFKKTAGPQIAGLVAGRIEKNNPNILYKCDENFNLGDQFIAPSQGASGKYLLFLHGTGSNTKSSFGGLMNMQGEIVYKNLYRKYEGRVVAYEHKTFSQSPVQNIIELIRQLPDDITLDLVSHSRGGLLGELLARIASKSIPEGAFSKAEIDLLQKNKDAVAFVNEIKELNTAVANKQIKINFFVRVACPAAGTTLVSERADNLLNVLFNVLSAIPGEVTGMIVDGIKALVTAVVNEKNSTGVLPGIECMKPDSNFIKTLNYTETQIDSPLVVIAGDAQGEGFINRIKMFLVDSFYKEDNDLVVNTASMKKGTRRKSYFPIYDERRGNVNHFHYFINPTSQQIIYNALTGNINISRGFYSSAVLVTTKIPEVVIPANRSAKSIKDFPVLYVLPGIMGSHLEANNDRIWLNYFRIAVGGLKQLKMNSTEAIKAEGINGSAYKGLVDYFSDRYYVIPFPYDWRKSVFDAGR